MQVAQDKLVLALGRILRFIKPTSSEIEFLSTIPGDVLTLKPKEMIYPSGGAKDVYLLLDGWAANASLVADGTERIHTVNLPGDMLGMASLVLAEPFDQTYALTEVKLRRIPSMALREIFERFPRVAAVIMLIAQEERAAKHEWNLLHGENAKKRFAGFLLRISERVDHLNRISGFDRAIPMTQRQIAEAVGVTPAYINQLLHNFQAAGLISYQRTRLEVIETLRLRQISGLKKWEVTTPDWLPSAN